MKNQNTTFLNVGNLWHLCEKIHCQHDIMDPGGGQKPYEWSASASGVFQHQLCLPSSEVQVCLHDQMCVYSQRGSDKGKQLQGKIIYILIMLWLWFF